MFNSERILYEVDTDFDHYQVVERQYEGRPARVLFSGIRRAAQSGIGLDDNPDLLFDYNQRMLELANGVYPKSVLVLGGGAFSLPMALLTALPEATIDVVELDAGLQPIAEQYFGLQPNERLKLHFGDARDFITSPGASYDLIIIDIFSELAIPRHCLTVEFIKLLHSRLNNGGCIAMNIIASYQGKNDGLIKSQIAGYSKYFHSVTIYPAGYGLTSWLPQNLMLVAQLSPVTDYKDYVRYRAIDAPLAQPSDAYSDSN